MVRSSTGTGPRDQGSRDAQQFAQYTQEETPKTRQRPQDKCAVQLLQTCSPTATIASATARMLALLLRACPRMR
jgi:hypothetical protein